MASHSVEIKRVLRRVRGGSQGYLVEGSDGRKYIGKFRENPQGTRTLINEWVGHWFFRQLGVTTPEITILHLSQRVVEEADLHFQVGRRKTYVETGRHLGSPCPVDPDQAAIFDFLPQNCFDRVINPDDFGKALVIDILLGQTDSRQCIFVRDQPGGNKNLMFRAHMIDHGWIFGGNRWAFLDSSAPRRSLHFGIYSSVDLQSVCERAIDDIREVTGADPYDAVKDIPGEWFSSGDHEGLDILYAEVFNRGARLDSLVRPHLQAVRELVTAPKRSREHSRLRNLCRVV